MSSTPLSVSRSGVILKPDASRVLLRPLVPGDAQRAAAIVARILAMDEQQVASLFEQVSAEFSGRHLHLHRMFLDRFEELRLHVPSGSALSGQRCVLIGAYFLTEYAVESAALFNPSLVPHPDQTGSPVGGLRFILSLRATGEGHISSITFRTGFIHSDCRIEIAKPSGLLTEARQIPNPSYERPLFSRTLSEMNLEGAFTRSVLGRLDERFTLQALRKSIDEQLELEAMASGVLHGDRTTADAIWALARGNYEVQFEPSQQLSERILFPSTPSQRNGIEDARFVCFLNDDGSRIYYATFTAFDGKAVVPELVETSDFLRFRFITLNGPAARNKGMALFPRKIQGRYAMLSRQDNESIYIMFSDNVHFWNEYQLLMQPLFPWELVQLGNCGSPIETEAGWLVLSHGVGAMRKYCIGAFLLDRDDPRRLIGRLREPLLEPRADEREGYVPNVVYTCGALVHGGRLILPYGLSDYATGFVTIPLDQVLGRMERQS